MRTLLAIILLCAAAPAQKTIEVWPTGGNAVVDGQTVPVTKHPVCWALEQSTSEWDTVLCHAGLYPAMTVGGKPGPWSNAFLPGGIQKVRLVGVPEDIDGDGDFDLPSIPHHANRQSVLTLAQDGPPGAKPVNARIEWYSWKFGGGYRYCVEAVFDQPHDFLGFSWFGCEFGGNGQTKSALRLTDWAGEIEDCYGEGFTEHGAYVSGVRAGQLEKGERCSISHNRVYNAARTGVQIVDRDISKDPTIGQRRPGTGTFYIADNEFDAVGCAAPDAPPNNCGSYAISVQGHAGVAGDKGQVVIRNNRILPSCSTGGILVRGESSRGHRYKDDEGQWVYVGGVTIAGNEIDLETTTAEFIVLAAIGQLNLGRNVMDQRNNVGIQLNYQGGGGDVREIVGWQMEPDDGFWERSGGIAIKRRDDVLSPSEIAALQKSPER